MGVYRMIFNINALGQVGVISDQQAHTLPPNAFSDALNVRFREGAAMRVKGYENMQTVPGQGMYILPYEYVDAGYWVYATSRAIYSWDGSTYTDITRTSGPLNGNLGDVFTGGVYNGVAVLNNGVDVPQMWTPDMVNATDLSGWPSTWTAGTIRPYRNFLIALNITEDGINYPTRFRWSDLADPGTVPSTWVADATNQAGDDVIEETQGALVEAEGLRNDLVLYKTDSAYLMTFVGGQFVMQNRPFLKSRGILAKRCAKEFMTGQHFVADIGDIYVHDGQQGHSIATDTVRRKIFSSIDTTNYIRSFVARNWNDDEVWFCYPEAGEFWPNMAAMWNWKTGAWGFRELPATTHIAFGVYPSTESQFNPTQRSMLSLKIDKSALYPATSLYPSTSLYPDDGESSLLAMESGYQAAGSDMTCTVTRTGLKPEPGDGVWMCRAVYPHAEGGALSVEVGSHDSPNDSVNWSSAQTFTPEGTQEKVDVRVTGRYLAFRVTFPAAASGGLASVDFDVVKVGTR